LGFDPAQRHPDMLRRISVLLGQKAQLWWDLPPADSFDLLARIYDLDLAAAKVRVKELSALLQCDHLLHVQLRRLSLGERMKMEIIGSLLHKPQILFLDEPTIGLDVVAQTTIRQFLAEHVQREKPTVILTSHYMDDIAQLARRLLLISHGRIVYDGTVEGFTARSETRQKITLRLLTPPTGQVELPGGQWIGPGQDFFSGEFGARDVGPALERIMSCSKVTDLRVEETDFEDVIRAFLEEESRLRKAGHTQPV